MTFPTIDYKTTNTNVPDELKTLLEAKFSSLEKYLGDETDVQCNVEFEQVAPHNSGDIYRVEANLWFKGTMYRAEATESAFEKAVDEVRAELDKELRRGGKRKRSLVRRGGRKLKEMMRFGR